MDNSLHANVLLDLPDVVVFDILTCWLDLKCVCNVDTSLCSRKVRARFVQLCQDEVVVFTHTPRTNWPNGHSWRLIEWIVTRNLKISNVQIPSNDVLENVNLCNKLLKLTGMHVNKMNIPHSSLFPAVGQFCPNLRNLQISNPPRSLIVVDSVFGVVLSPSRSNTRISTSVWSILVCEE